MWSDLFPTACGFAILTLVMVGSDSRFVVIADVHVLGEAGTEILQAAIRSINALSPAPDFVLVAGDFVECGAPREYELFTS
ncbi:MAG: hypothetical protein FJ279_34370, partial [Planctomycetes bacterium]|nr:hypothetical protein [Planctomycetota bacterium]